MGLMGLMGHLGLMGPRYAKALPEDRRDYENNPLPESQV